MKVKLESIEPSNRKNKRLKAIFSNGETTHFGLKKEKLKGKGTYIDHKDDELKKNYRARHKSDLKTKDPTRAGYLSYYILWNKPTLEKSIKDYKKKFNL